MLFFIKDSRLPHPGCRLLKLKVEEEFYLCSRNWADRSKSKSCQTNLSHGKHLNHAFVKQSMNKACLSL